MNMQECQLLHTLALTAVLLQNKCLSCICFERTNTAGYLLVSRTIKQAFKPHHLQEAHLHSFFIISSWILFACHNDHASSWVYFLLMPHFYLPSRRVEKYNKLILFGSFVRESLDAIYIIAIQMWPDQTLLSSDPFAGCKSPNCDLMSVKDMKKQKRSSFYSLTYSILITLGTKMFNSAVYRF